MLAFTAAPLSASEDIASVGRQYNDHSNVSQVGSKTSLGTFETVSVGLLVEIPGSKLLFRHHLDLIEGSTVSQALETVYTVKHGLVCCDSRDIFAINGLAVDPYQEKWWIIKVNGNAQNSSSTRKLTDHDVVELIYMENATHPVAHVHLEDWVQREFSSQIDKHYGTDKK